MKLTSWRGYTGTDYCNFILATALLVRRNFPAHQCHVIQPLVNKALALGSTPQLGERDWNQMKDDLGRALA